jgi:hypothetical protein
LFIESTTDARPLQAGRVRTAERLEAPSNLDFEHIVTSNEWQEYHIDAKVPQEATKITYGFAYLGEGAAYIDDVSVVAGAGI